MVIHQCAHTDSQSYWRGTQTLRFYLGFEPELCHESVAEHDECLRVVKMVWDWEKKWEQAKAATATNKEEYFKLTGSATSPPVSLTAWTEAPDGPTLPSAGRDGTTHSEGAFILQLYKSCLWFQGVKLVFLAWGAIVSDRKKMSSLILRMKLTTKLMPICMCSC